MKNLEEYKKEIQDAITYAADLRFDKKHPWHRNLIALYLSIIEYSDTLVHLVDNEKTIAIPLVFRGLLEAFVDFKNLAEDKAYGYHMEASYLKEWLKVIEEASKNKNAFLDSLSKEKDLPAKIQEHENELAKLKGIGFQPLNQYEKFDKADMVNEYRSIYNFVCSHSHNNIRALIDRFFVINKEQTNFTITLFREQEEGEFDRYCTTGKLYLRNASYNIHAILETGHKETFNV